MKSQKGFATILLISVLPAILAGGFFMFTAFSLFKSDLGTLNTCRALQLETQNKVAKNLTKLLSLNPKALKLRLSQARAEKALISAINTGNPVAIAAAETYLLYIQMQRQALDIRQKVLITGANTFLKSGSKRLQEALLAEWKRHTRGVRTWFEGRLILGARQVPSLAVQADFPEVAPVYQVRSPFAELQHWSETWVLELKTSSFVSRFFNFNGRFQRSCDSSIYLENASWTVKLKKARFLLRDSF